MASDLFAISGKTALITGGSRGIGAMIAAAYVAAGARVYVAARKADELAALVASLGPAAHCVPIVADLATLDGVRGLAEAFAAHETKLDILVNNAGATWGAPIESFPESGWDKVMDLNVKAMFFLTQSLLPQLRAATSADNPARVINISSANALRYSHMDNFSYSTSKAAVLALTQHLSATLAREHILVNAIAPGFFPSKMTDFLLADPETRKQAEAVVPVKRVGDPDDIGGTAIYLASRASRYMSGACLVLDGGVVAQA
jgi:NAD(P)-dependent dehydrogenase (short-subunit alcohol dehydrogenase family)